MKRALRLSTVSGLFLLACGGEPPPPATTALVTTPDASAARADPGPSAPVAPHHLDKDTPEVTSRGTTFAAPSGWTLTTRDALQILQAPEGDYRIAVVEAEGTSADDAVNAAWTTLEPTFGWKLRLAHDRPARFGWEARRSYEYETSPNEKKSIEAVAMKHGAAWTVVLFDGGDATAGKRSGQIDLVWDSARPTGYVKESFAGKTAHTLDVERVKHITDMLDRAREDAGVPGFAIALVQNGQVIFSGGFGVRELGKPAEVDDDTLFPIASNTKALTTLLMAKAVDQGKFTWDTPATQVDPDFKLGDEATTRSVLMRHLVCACTGMPRQDLEWLFEFGKQTPESEMTVLGTFQPTSKFGEVFQYSNMLAGAAGYVVAHALSPKVELGVAYDKAMKDDVLGPLGMTETTFDFKKALAGNHAGAQAEDVDGNVAHAIMKVNYAAIPLRPAGGAWSSAQDLTKYVQLELAKGKLPSGAQYVSETNLMERRKPNVGIGETSTYGMGLITDTKYGIPVIDHGGSLIGYKSDMFWLPDQQVGGVLLTNSDAGQLFEGPFIRKTLEELFDGAPEAKADLTASIARRKEDIGKARERLLLPASQDVTATLATHYQNDALGPITVQHSPGKDGTETTFDFGEWKSRMASKKNDDGTTSLVTVVPGLDGFELVVGAKDGKKTLTVHDAQHDYVFVEK